ncbi:hypothetical protein B0H19DRAFT_27157 [Mycena capillaripes]|nr:hypothetical protein B0H19DRAFT_27157 [Mycena capillaripes]
MSTGMRPLRILYSLNGSPQYILARSLGAVPVQFIPSQGTETGGASSSRSVAPPPPSYASASLKTCLNTICRSSPEIIQDPSRDFSVYLLDPLETDCAPAQANMSSQLSASEAPEARVAVGLGLMSWALMTDETDAMPVTGTLKVAGAGTEMLEIIFSLRETVPMQKAALPEALRSWSAPSTSFSTRGKKKPVPYPPARKKSKAAATPVTESDKFLAAAPIYVGPERRPPGAPPGRNLPIADDEEDDVVIVKGPQRPDDPAKESPLLDFLAFLKVISPEIERNKTLGSILGLVHGPDGTAMQPPAELANAMTLFSDLQRGSQSSHRSQPESTPPSHNQHRRKSSSTDDEIVVLNKENVNPKVFRRRAERGKDDAKLHNAIEPSTTPTASSSGLPSHTTSQHPPEPPRLAPSNQNEPPRRKRTLSEFMEEQEASRDREKALKKTQYYRQPERTMSRSMSAASFLLPTTIPAATTSTANPTHAESSRKRTVSCASSPGRREPTGPLPPSGPAVSASSPVRPPRKPYVVPDWARTDTATQPRLSERVVSKPLTKEQEEEAKKKDAMQRRKEAMQRKNESRRRPPKEGKPRKSDRRTSANATAQSASSPVKKAGVEELPLPAPVAASSHFPVFNNEQAPRPPFTALPFGSPSRSASQSNIHPSTPPRKRRANTIATPTPVSLFTPDSSSLFTPASASWAAGRVLNLGRRSMSPSSRKASTQESEQTRPSEEPEFDDDDRLGQELDSAFDELDFPQSSLPTASSDMDVETEQMPGCSQGYDSDDSDDDDAPPKQHWVGLPPSSPPPPSSPLLGASPMDDDDVEEPPLPTSDGDLDLVSEQETPDPEITSYSLEELGNLLNLEDLANFFPSPTIDNSDTANFFDQFTNHNAEVSSDDSAQTMKDWGLEATNPDLDFSEFWESVRPLVEGISSPLDLEQSNEEPIAVDHAKLAGDVHSLFAGCLV